MYDVYFRQLEVYKVLKSCKYEEKYFECDFLSLFLDKF